MDINLSIKGQPLSIVSMIKDSLCRSNKTLAVAESCTGGLISHMLTEVSGASGFLLLSVIAYSSTAKRRILLVDELIMGSCGLVSAETAIAMARGVREVSGADYSIATTGNLGPTALEGKDVGLVYIASSSERECISKELRLIGNRSENKLNASVEALLLLYNTIKSEMG